MLSRLLALTRCVELELHVGCLHGQRLEVAHLHAQPGYAERSSVFRGMEALQVGLRGRDLSVCYTCDLRRAVLAVRDALRPCLPCFFGPCVCVHLAS